jgi:hypothetical protein
MRGSEDGELCTGIVDQQSSVEMAHLREGADLRQEYAAPGVFVGSWSNVHVLYHR